MSMVIANNMQAVNTKRQFAISGRGQSSAMEKLSSGYKINTGKDDPSGLVISEKLRSQLNGLKRAQQNTEEAINVMGIAEGALNEMNAILKKMKALAIHSNNTGVTSPDQIAADQAEMDSAVQTLDRIAQTTKFSEENLLNGAKDIAYERTTASKGTQQNSLLDVRETGFSQIFKRDDYAVSISFTGTTNADMATGAGDVDFTQQASKAYLEVDTSKDPENTAQLLDGAFTTAQQFTLTGTKGSRAFNFKKGETVATMVEQIKSAADSTGIDAALVFNSDQQIHMTTTGSATADDSAEPVYTDQTFTIAGLNTSAGAAVKFGMGSELGDYLEGGSINFKVDLNASGKYDLSVTIADSDTNSKNVANINIAKDWDGATNASLQTAIDKAISYAGGANAELLTTIKENLTLEGSGVDASKSSTLADGANFNAHPAGAVANDYVVLEGIFGDDPVGGKADGTVALKTDSVNWNTVYSSIEDPAVKAAMMAEADAGTLQIKVEAVAGSTQENMEFNLSIVGADPAADPYMTQTVGVSAAELAALKTNGTVDLAALTTGAFSGTQLTIETGKPDISKINPANGTSGALTASSITGGVMLSKRVDSTDANAGIAAAVGAIGDPATTAMGATAAANLTGVNADAVPTAVTISVTQNSAGAYNDSALKAALDEASATDIAFSVRLNEGQSKADLVAGNGTYSLVATIGGSEVVLDNAWDGTALTNKTYSAETLKDINAGVDDDILNGLADIKVTTVGAIDFEASSAAGQAFVEATSFAAAEDAKLTATETVVATDIYDFAGAPDEGKGNISIKFDDVNIQDFVDTMSDQAGFLAAFNTGGNGKVDVTINPKVDVGTGVANGEFTISLNFYDDATKASFGSVVIDSTSLALNANGETANGDYITLADGGMLAGMQIKVSNSEKSAFVGDDTELEDVTATLTPGITPTYTPVAGAQPTSGAMEFAAVQAGAMGQIGGIADDTTAARSIGTVAVFNNVLDKDPETGATTGVVEKGITGIDITADGAASIQLGQNTDGQGRVFVKFLDDQSFELYKDSSMSKESLVATGTKGKAIQEANNSGLGGITLNMAGTELTKVGGVYFSLAGIEGQSENQTYSVGADGAYVSKGNGTYGVSYSGDVVGEVVGDATKDTIFDQDRTYISGVELGKNTDNEGKVYLKSVYDDKNKTIKVEAYKDRNMRAEDLIAASDLFSVVDADDAAAKSMTVVLNEVRNADNTAGTGFGMVLSTDSAMFTGIGKDRTFTSEVTFQNLGARLFAQDYGSANYLKITQDKGNIFNYYGTPGDNGSKQMIDATSGGITVQVNGQDATLSINGSQVKTNGLELKMATQDIQANLVFNAGSVGSTTLAQVGYDAGSIFTKNGALNLGSEEAEAADSGKYEHLSGKMANAGHVTNERVDDFQGGMQLQLGEGAGDQNRTIVAIKSVTSENLGRVTKGGYWDGNAVYTERTFTMKDVFGGGAASLKQSPTMAMAVIEQSIADVSELRAQIGAVQSNMLQTNSNNLAVTMENIQKTESGIRDADMADEMTEFTKNQVLQSAAMSMMSQANQSSQNVLQLLR